MAKLYRLLGVERQYLSPVPGTGPVYLLLAAGTWFVAWQPHYGNVSQTITVK
jgi:hypothetical protein